LVVELSAKSPLVALLLLGLLVACGSNNSAKPTPDGAATIDAEQALSQAVDQLLALRSAAFTLEHLKGSTVLVPGVLMSKVYGDVVIPGRFRVTVEAETESPKLYLEISIVTIDDTAYMTDIFSGKWNQIPKESLPFDLSGLGQTLADVVDAVEEPRRVGEERLGGVDTVRIAGKIASEDLSGLVPGAGEGYPVRLELWLDDEGLLRQVAISGRVVPTDDEITERLLTLDDINQPVQITPPSGFAG